MPVKSSNSAVVSWSSKEGFEDFEKCLRVMLTASTTLTLECANGVERQNLKASYYDDAQ